MDLLVIEGHENKEAGIQKLLNEKENAIQLLKKKLKIPATQLIQASELAKLEKVKEYLSSELTDCKLNY